MMLVSLAACQGGSSSDVAPASTNSGLTGFTLTQVKGTNISYARKNAVDGKILEEGYVKDNKREGTWTINRPGSDFPKTQASYVNGILNGPYIEFDQENKILLLAYYRNNLLEGKWFRYQFGRLAFSAEYRGGKLHGPYREYRGEGEVSKLAKEITYVDGQLDGPYRFFDDDGNVVLEYTYRNGKKIGE
jgi:antitoxin component YwqK of YwqJK toxin-antitoxin module